jgi:O-antigen ligase
MLQNAKSVENYPKASILFITIIACSIFLTFGTSYRSSFYYFNWLGGVVLILLFIINILRTKKVKKFTLYIFCSMSIWWILNIFLTSYAFDQDRHFKILLLTIFYTLIAILLLEFFLRVKEDIFKIFYFLNLFWVLLSSIYLILYLTGFYQIEGAFSGAFENRNLFAINTIFLISFLIFFKDKLSQKRAKRATLLIIISILLIIMTLSVKGALGLGIVLFIYYFSGVVKLGKKILFAILAVILVLSLFVFENKLYDRVSMYFNVFFNGSETIYTTEGNKNAIERLTLIEHGFDTVRENLWTGVGIDNSRYYLYVINSKGNEKYLYSHNNYIEMALNGGIFVFLLYYIPIFIILVKFLMIRKKSKIITFGIMLIFLKLFWDFGFVSYNNFTNMFIHALFIYIYFQYKYNKNELLTIFEK